jgi:16S rRNA C967 or C1407 C5-methylase (RsmB/RsmF family)
MAALEAAGQYSRSLLAAAVALLAPGGALVYSTCTLSPLENEGVVGWALATYGPRLSLEAAPPPRHGRSGIPGHGLAVELCPLVQRFDPGLAEISDADDSIGFFFAKFRLAPA